MSKDAVDFPLPALMRVAHNSISLALELRDLNSLASSSLGCRRRRCPSFFPRAAPLLFLPASQELQRRLTVVPRHVVRSFGSGARAEVAAFEFQHLGRGGT